LSGDDLVPLSGTNWHLWPVVVLRGAGFPVRLVEQLADETLADIADGVLRSGSVTRQGRPDPQAMARYEAQFDASIGRVTAAIGAVARDARFREAVAWQNRAFVRSGLDRVGPGTPRDSRTRRRETAIASYLQRYTTKNDSIGYFGPVGWARWQSTGPAVRATPGAQLLSRRTVYFETWAMDAVGAALAARPGLLRGLAPRTVPTNHMTGRQVYLPAGDPVRLTAEDADVLRLCDGVRTVQDIIDARAARNLPNAEADVLARLRSLRERCLIFLDFSGPIETFPERRLRRRLARVPDAAARAEAIRDLDRLVAAKDAVADAAGEADRVAGAIERLGQTFERLTGVPGTRLPGQNYAARTIVYEDATRDLDLRLGPELIAALAGPLGLVLDSGRWLAERVGADCLERLDAHFERRRKRSGADAVPLASLLALASRDFYSESRMPPVAASAAAELQHRWSRILACPAGSHRHEVAVSDIASAVAREFASAPPAWAAGLVHSPDVMIAAASIDAINRGDYQFVLGELHPALNTMESQALVEQSADPGTLLAMAEAAAGKRRVVSVAPRAWAGVTARTSLASAMLSPSYAYWAVGDDDVSNYPVDPIPVAALAVVRDGGRLVVRDNRAGRVFPLVEVVGEYLSSAVVRAFHLLPPARHTPRVSIGRLVVARERWQVPVRKCAWAFQLDERRRYLQLRAWSQRYGMPRRAFYSVPIEAKPLYVDFTSIPLVNLLAGVVRRMAKTTPDGTITVSEMLPDPAQTWLPDAAGETYTSELRMVAVDGMRS
jgi:hypothetical protein